MLNLSEAFNNHDVFLITVDSEITRDIIEFQTIYYLRDRIKYPLKFGLLALLILTPIYLSLIGIECAKIFLKERPDFLVTTGGDEAIPICYFGKLMGSKIICIESFTRIHNRSGTGLLLYPIADLFLVQWESLLSKYGKKARYWGSVA
jgi:beta-1,4-N-acetylglucosaminyltransferase